MIGQTETAVFGGGCFWCTEAVFKMLRGITSVTPGYTGGTTENPTYEDICNGNTGHAEVIKIEFDSEQIKFKDLLTVFFASHDPTTLNRQGNDVGAQYRSVVYYTSDEQRTAAENFVRELNASSTEGKPIVTEILSLDKFFKAENYHHDYYAKNPRQPYCEVIINPKLKKVQKQFAELLNTHSS